jgi:7 transmembrane sweet-taste receptor of 3 GCPR
MPPPHVDYDFKNDIHRSDDYFASDDHSNKNFFVLKKSDEKKVHEKIDETNMLINSSQPLNKTFQLQSPSSSLVQARLEMLTDFFDVPPSPLSSVYSTPSRPTSLSKAHGVVLAAKKYIHPTNSTLRQIVAVETAGLRKDTWVIPVLLLAGVSMLMMGAFEIFVLCKTRRTSPNRRHLFLGQMLLLGLFTCSGLSALLAARPTSLSCATIRFGAGVSFAIVFASLLVKCIFLISLNGGVSCYNVHLLVFLSLKLSSNLGVPPSNLSRTVTTICRFNSNHNKHSMAFESSGRNYFFQGNVTNKSTNIYG